MSQTKKKAKIVAAKKVLIPAKKRGKIIAVKKVIRKPAPLKKKIKISAAKKAIPAKRKSRIVAAKKAIPLKKKAKIAEVKKAAPSRLKAKIAAVKKLAPVKIKSKSKPGTVKKAAPPVSKAKPVKVKKVTPAVSKGTPPVKKVNGSAKPTVKTKAPASKAAAREITHGEDLHLIPVPGELHPITTKETHQIENTFHHKEDVAFHQANQKMAQAMTTRRSSKKIFRTPGRR